MGPKLQHGSFGGGRSFIKYCAQHLLDVQNYAEKLQKKLAGNGPERCAWLDDVGSSDAQEQVFLLAHKKESLVVR
jgi:hypothetical protein